MCVHIYTHTRIYTYTYIYICKYVCISIHKYVFMYTSTSIYMYMYVCVCTYIHMYMPTCTYYLQNMLWCNQCLITFALCPHRQSKKIYTHICWGLTLSHRDIYVYIHIYIYIDTQIYAYTCIYIYAYTYFATAEWIKRHVSEGSSLTQLPYKDTIFTALESALFSQGTTSPTQLTIYNLYIYSDPQSLQH